MKKSTVRILALLLVAVMTVMSLTACGKTQEPEETTCEEAVTTEITTADILGFDKQDYEGREFNVYLNNSYLVNERDFFVEDYTVDNLSKAVYERNVACEEYLGIELNFDPQPGAYKSEASQRMYQLISANACDYDMVLVTLGEAIGGNYISIWKNVMEMDYIDLDHEWWVQDMIDYCSINNQLYFLTGDACLSTYSYIGCVLANLDVADKWKVDVDLYQTVKDGDWTLDEMFRLSKLVGDDENSNGVMDSGSESYGLALKGITSRLMWSSCNMELVVRQADGTFAIRSALDDRMTTFANKLKTQYDDIHTNYLSDSSAMFDDFVNNRVFFVITNLSDAENMKAHNIDSPFAILPMPMYDDAQEDYISVNIAAYNTILFPSSVQSPELCGQVAEFMGWQGKEVVVPEYYDVTLKYKKNDDNANIEMLGLIRNSLRVTPNESYGVISAVGATAPAAWIQLTDYTARVGFYANPDSYWALNAPDAAAAIRSYVLQYFY